MGHVEFWVHGIPVNTPSPDSRVGSPICMECEVVIDTGISFHGNGALCMSCIDALRQRLWDRMGKVLSCQPKGDQDGK